MTDASDSHTPDAHAAGQEWVEPLFARSEPALAGLAPASRARRVTADILAGAGRRRQRLRQLMTGLMFGALGGLAWLLAAFGPELLAQANALSAPAGFWSDALMLGLILGAAALCAVLARPRTV